MLTPYLMKYFKVHFENNAPISAERIPELATDEIIHISEVKGKKVINWLIVYAEDETDAVEDASDLLKKYYLFFGLHDQDSNGGPLP
jgi:hypothetical protein